MRIALVAEGSSDEMLLPFLSWLVKLVDTDRAHEIVPIDLRAMRRPPGDLEGKSRWLTSSNDSWSLVLVHRDSDSRDPEPRYQKIERARVAAGTGLPVVPVVPVRCSETWLLFNEKAIREAAGAPDAVVDLGLPAFGELERRAGTKAILHDALTTASGTRGRRRARFRAEQRCHAVATAIDDWSPLLALTACRRLRADLAATLSLVPGA